MVGNCESEVSVVTKDEIIEQQAHIIAQQQEIIEQLQQKILELEERLKKNSSNSSNPPSSDGPGKEKRKSLREKSGKKAGAQKGHTGRGLTLMVPVTETVCHKPAQCENCPMNRKCVSCGRSAVRNVVDVEIKTKVTAHYTEKYVCPMAGGEVISGEFPEDINSSIQYGNGICALAVALNTAGMMSINRVHELLMAILGVPISTGTISAMVERFSKTISDTVEGIKRALLSSPVVHCDETGTRVEGTNYWVHSACDAQYTYLSLQSKRGYAGMEEAGFLPSYSGTIIHDCWSPYWSVSDVRHGLCCAHLLRELQGVIDNAPEQADWAGRLQQLLLEMNQCRRETLELGMAAVDNDSLQNFSARYDLILQDALALNPLAEKRPGRKGRPKKGKRRALIDRLMEHKGEVCLFIHDLRVPFTNNLAEQSVRMVKVKTKVSGCFRTSNGAQNFVRIMSYLQTALKHSINAWHAISTALAGNPCFPWA